jgi:hypothetical protein
MNLMLSLYNFFEYENINKTKPKIFLSKIEIIKKIKNIRISNNEYCLLSSKIKFNYIVSINCNILK